MVIYVTLINLTENDGYICYFDKFAENENVSFYYFWIAIIFFVYEFKNL